MRLPGDTHRLTMYGQTGTGKTVAGLWHLSHRSYTRRPWLLFDFKGDEHIAQIPYTEEISLKTLPKQQGLYVVRPVPEADDEAVEELMWKIWRQENTGVFVDEGYMVSRGNSAFQALLTQGRSKSIPMITLSQRPVWMNRFTISEADFHQIFRLADQSDRDVVQRFIPHDVQARLPEYHSYYYDVAQDSLAKLKPVPHPDEILQTFEDRLQKRTRFL
jgi:hypothetical protein